MPSWQDINAQIASCRASGDPVRRLEALFAQTRDGHVAMALGDEHRRAGQIAEARKWYEEATRRYPMESYKARARQALSGLATTASPVSAAKAATTDSAVLHVISCSKRKAWDSPLVTERYLPAWKAYQGDEIAAWLARPESQVARWIILSAKYGFIEPDHPMGNYDVTFNDTGTGPITDDALRAQVEHQARWADHVPLRNFAHVVVHGTSAYVQKTKKAFARTAAAVRSADVTSEQAALQIIAPAAGGRERVTAVARALTSVPMSAYETLDTKEPEWPLFAKLARFDHPWGVLSALAFGLCDYQLGAGGAVAYWDAIDLLLGQSRIHSADDLEGFIARLIQQPVSSRLAEQKLGRIRRLIASDLAGWCADRTLSVLGADARSLWDRLAAAMMQPPDAKTIAFAMKCFDLLHKANTGHYAVIQDAPIIVDLRIARVSLTSGLLQIPGVPVARSLQDATTIAADHHQQIIAAWRAVQHETGSISLFRIDSLLWQVAEPIFQERANRGQAISRTVEVLAAAGIPPAVAGLVATELTAALD